MPQFYADFNDHSLIPPQFSDFHDVTRSGSLRSIVAVFPIGCHARRYKDNKLIELNEYGHSIVFEEKINEEVRGMKERPGDERERVVKRKRLLFSVVIILLLNLFLSGCALGHSAWWKEEVLLHDGQTIIVDRALKRGGRHEITQPSSITEHTLRFTPPGSRKSILWKSEFDPGIGYSTLDLMALDIVNGTPYIVTKPTLCLSYNKWGRPNPPYIFFKYSEGQWRQIPLQEFPPEIMKPNVVISLESDERFLVREHQQSGFVSVQKVTELNSPLKEQIYRSIIRTPLKAGSIGVSCPGLVFDGKYWRGFKVLENNPSLGACLDECKKENISDKYCPCNRLY